MHLAETQTICASSITVTFKATSAQALNVETYIFLIRLLLDKKTDLKEDSCNIVGTGPASHETGK